MTKKVDNPQIAVLQQEREQVIAELARLRDDLRNSFESDDIDDAASDLIERDKTQALIFSLERKIENIDHALNQANSIGYGICERCGNPIEPERLEIFPETTLCISCKRETERLGAIRR